MLCHACHCAAETSGREGGEGVVEVQVETSPEQGVLDSDSEITLTVGPSVVACEVLSEASFLPVTFAEYIVPSREVIIEAVSNNLRQR